MIHIRMPGAIRNYMPHSIACQTITSVYTALGIILTEPSSQLINLAYMVVIHIKICISYKFILLDCGPPYLIVHESQSDISLIPTISHI